MAPPTGCDLLGLCGAGYHGLWFLASLGAPPVRQWPLTETAVMGPAGSVVALALLLCSGAMDGAIRLPRWLLDLSSFELRLLWAVERSLVALLGERPVMAGAKHQSQRRTVRVQPVADLS